MSDAKWHSVRIDSDYHAPDYPVSELDALYRYIVRARCVDCGWFSFPVMTANTPGAATLFDLEEKAKRYAEDHRHRMFLGMGGGA